jgi:Fe(II)/alpha-ketoglutarate-dependent arginine beta-hydroxylase
MEEMALKISLTSAERDELATLVHQISQEFTSFEDVNFLIKLHGWTKLLPDRVFQNLLKYKYHPEDIKYLVIDGLPVDELIIGKTPEHWDCESTQKTLSQCIIACLYSSVLGDVFSWSTQQDGNVIHDVLPIKGDENEQLGTGSLQDIEWHVEDAFHEFRGDYCTFFCLRNHDHIPTTCGAPDFSKLSTEDSNELFKLQFMIKPDNSHKEVNESDSRRKQREESDCAQLAYTYQRVSELDQNPDKISVLFGNRNDPFIRIDPYFMEDPATPEAKRALDNLIKLVDDSIEEVALEPGEILLIDNYRMVHGRRRFVPRYDGTDRWMKRINVTRDIRRSASMRATIKSRNIL